MLRIFNRLLDDPRNDSQRLIPDVYHETNAQGVGLMYRVIDTARLFDLLRERDFGGQTCALELNIADSFLPENAGNILLRFEDGRVQQVRGEAPDYQVSMDIADFSSLLSGCVDFCSLVRYGLAEISQPAHVPTINRIFAVDQKPICTTSF